MTNIRWDKWKLILGLMINVVAVLCGFAHVVMRNYWFIFVIVGNGICCIYLSVKLAKLIEKEREQNEQKKDTDLSE